MTELRVALLSSCTSELLQRPLLTALEARSLRASVWTGGFGQYRQEVIVPGSALYAQNPSVILLYVDGADVFQELIANPFRFSFEARREIALQAAAEVALLAETLRERLPEATLVLNTTSIDPLSAVTGLEYNTGYGLQDAVHTYNEELAKLPQRLATVVVVDIASLTAAMGYQNWWDARLWYLARCRWSRQAMLALAERYATAISSRLGRMRKCLVVDLDNTLWGGIAGEDGINGLSLGDEGAGRAYADFQQELLNLSRKGILLAICSKNNPEDALAVIRNHPGMRLREDNFAAMRINWQNKAANIRDMAEELNIGLDSFVFIDDNPAERALVREMVPEVLVPDWPADPGDYRAVLLELGACHFYKLSITAEDRSRGAMYQAQAQRRNLERSAESLEAYYVSLEMRAKIGAADEFTIPRIAQLTQKTNQFNLTTRRYTAAEVSAFRQDANHAVWWMELSDRFGSNGIVGVLILRREQNTVWHIDTFLLSCRVMGRTAEDAFLATVAQQVGATALIGEFRPTAKNAPVGELYPRLGFRRIRQGEQGELWRLDLAATPLESPSWFAIELVSNRDSAGPLAGLRLESESKQGATAWTR
jgi:FkbH-like protein